MDRQSITNLLMTNDKAIARALVAIYNRQTVDEQASETTRCDNGVGFTGADAQIGSSMAKFFMVRGYLTEKQLAHWKKPNAKGVWRICKYAGQLLSIANANEAAKQA